MDKYSGCNIVESVVKEVERQETPKRKPRKTFFIRFIIAAVIVGAILALHYVPIAAFESARDAIRSVFCYDVFGRTEFGTSVFFG